MFLDRSQRAEIEMLIPAEPCFGLPWRWIFAAALIFVMVLVAAI